MNKITSLIFLLCLLPLSAIAATYKVEILVFENTELENVNERWSDVIESPDAWGAIPVENGLDADTIKLLPDNSKSLKQVSEKLQLSTRYEVLYHQVWQQPVFSQEDEHSAWIAVPGVLEGTIKLHKKKYLHVKTDLLYTGQYGAAHLKQSRRLKSKQLHYLDHPLFGILIRVVRI